nr:hypothetical protein [Vibrio sp. UCD-FRSSP16_10]
MLMVIFFVLASTLIALGITLYLNHKAKQYKVKCFLDSKKQANFSVVHELLGGVGKSTQRENRDKFEDAGIYNRELLRYYTPIKLSLFVLCTFAILLFLHETIEMLISFTGAIIMVIVAP